MTNIKVWPVWAAIQTNGFLDSLPCEPILAGIATNIESAEAMRENCYNMGAYDAWIGDPIETDKFQYQDFEGQK
jgi:hypothetical protein